jgi:predicted ester cyclase
MAEEKSASDTATKVQAVAANVRQARTRGRRSSKNTAETVARRYFEAIGAHELDEAVAMWAHGGRENVRGQVDVLAPEGVRTFIGSLLDALPDLRVEILSITTQDDRCALQWRFTGTFAGPGHLSGVAPTGDPVAFEGIDLITVRDGLIQANDAFTDTMTIPRQIGMMPALGSTAEQGLMGAFNATTRVRSSLPAGEAELVADGVWVVQGQSPGHCNVYLIEDDGGVTLFDAGARTMTRAVARAGAKLGGIRRVVLGHGHTDHRGVAPRLGVPVLCHPDEVQDAEGSGGFRYWPADLAGLPPVVRQVHRLLHRYVWDGGPVKISDTVTVGAEHRLLLHDRHVGAQLRSTRARAGVQPRHRPGAGEHPQARGARTRGGMARTCRALDGRCARPARTRRRRTLSVVRRGRQREKLAAPRSDYTDPLGNVLTLRGSLTPAARREHAQTLSGLGGRASNTQEDTWQRAVELLFERLAVRWVIAGAPIHRQRELLMRFRAATSPERTWIREVLREHCAEHFPDVQAP